MRGQGGTSFLGRQARPEGPGGAVGGQAGSGRRGDRPAAGGLAGQGPPRAPKQNVPVPAPSLSWAIWEKPFAFREVTVLICEGKRAVSGPWEENLVQSRYRLSVIKMGRRNHSLFHG